MFDEARPTPEANHVKKLRKGHDFEGETPPQSRFIEKLNKQRRLPLALAGTAISLTSLVGVFNADIQAGKAIASQSQPEINPINVESYTEGSSATFYLAGFDTKNGDILAKKMHIVTTMVAPGEAESVNYAEAPLDHVEIAKQIIEYVAVHKPERISLVGNSGGGTVAFEVADYLTQHTDIEIETIQVKETADGYENLTPESQEKINMLIGIARGVKDGKYSRFARYGLTMAQESERFTSGEDIWMNIGKFFETSGDAWQEVSEKRRPPAWGAVDQALAIANSNIQQNIKNIGERRGERRMPIIIYYRTLHSEDDTVVDVVSSSRNICYIYAPEAGLSCTIVFVDGEPHTSYQFDTEANIKGLAPSQDSLIAQIELERKSYALSRFSNMAVEDVLTGK